MSDRSPPGIGARRADYATLAIALFLFALAAIVTWDAATISSGAASYSRVGPKAFPYGVAIGLLGLAVATGISASATRRETRSHVDLAPILWVVGGLLAQIALLPLAGFSIATGAVFALTARAFGGRPLLLTYPIGVALSLAVWLVFALGLRLILPAGTLERFASARVMEVGEFLRPIVARLVDFVRDAALTAIQFL